MAHTFERFHIDIGIGDPLLSPVEYLETPALLTFAGIAPTVVPCYPSTQQIAEKYHAYTRPHVSGVSSTFVENVIRTINTLKSHLCWTIIVLMMY